MKLSEIKHDHSLTDLLKIFIFSILMLLPFLSVLTRCMYVTFNKNAYQSYSTNEIIELKQIATSDSLIEGLDYTIQYKNKGLTTRNSKIMYNTISINWENYFPNIVNSNVGGFAILDNNNLYIYDTNGTYMTNAQNIWGNTLQGFEFNYKSISGTENFNGGNVIYLYITYQSETLDNAFEYSFQKMSQDNMFNWTQNTALYSGIHAMTTNLQIQTNIIAILLTYWTILTIVYVIIDIVLKCFTLLTHGFSRKTS